MTIQEKRARVNEISQAYWDKFRIDMDCIQIYIPNRENNPRREIFISRATDAEIEIIFDAVVNMFRKRIA